MATSTDTTIPDPPTTWLTATSTETLRQTADEWLVLAEAAAHAGHAEAARAGLETWHAILDELDRRREEGAA